MAVKRMFSMQIVDTDAFVEMPNDSQLLYFRLCLAADDDGFVANPRRVMRSYGFSEDSMKLLIAKKFTLVMKHAENVVLLIKHWKMHNTIKNDRYKPSPYHDLLRYVYLDKNNAYSLNPGEGKRPALPTGSGVHPPTDPEWIQNGSVDKARIEEERLNTGEDNNSFSLSSEEKEIKEKEAPPGIPSLTGDERAARVEHFAKTVKSFANHGYPTDGPYRLAEVEGITREEIDKWILEGREEGDTT